MPPGRMARMPVNASVRDATTRTCSQQRLDPKLEQGLKSFESTLLGKDLIQASKGCYLSSELGLGRRRKEEGWKPQLAAL